MFKPLLITYLHFLVLFGFTWYDSFASPVQRCPANDTSIFYISDTVDPCSFYWCVRGTFVRHRSLKCAPGSGTVADYAGYHNPCTEMIAECRRKTSDGTSDEDTEDTTEEIFPTLNLYYTYYYFYYLPAIVPSITYVAHNYYVPGGQFVRGISDVYTCVRACASDIYCTGVDFDTDNLKCWFHREDTICYPTVIKSAHLHFRLYICDDEVTRLEDQKKRKDNAEITTIAPPADDKDSEPASYVGKHILGGKLMTKHETLESCLRGCLEDRTCSGFDYDGKWDACWFHGVLTECQPMQIKETCIHFRLRQCSSKNDVPVAYPNTHAVNGFRLRGIRRPDECFRACTGACTAVDFDSKDNSCWIHAQDSCLRMKSRNFCVHIRKQPCVG